MVFMKSTGIRTLKAHLSAYVRKAMAGETVIVTEHGRPVAQLCPLPESALGFERLVSRGLVREAQTPRDRRWIEPSGLRLKKGTVAQLLAAERGET